MITHIKGKLIEKHPTYVIVECNGIGYWLNISLNTSSQISENEAIFLYTHLLVKEDSHTLFGFTTKTEREIFRMLISVSGVGPSIARIMLSSMTTDEIQHAIGSGKVSIIQSVKGIGAKTAQRVIIDLKDKILKSYTIDEDSFDRNNTTKEEALSALEVLGFTNKQSEKVLDKILMEDTSVPLEILIKKALKNL
jgi:Holliday junction DNA helicase RuvA